MTDKPRFKLGMKEPTYDSRDRLFGTYRTGAMPVVPAEFGDYRRIPHGGWGMLGNDEYGCCFPAGQGHAVMLESAEGGREDVVVTSETLADYFAMNGVKPGQPGSASDQGTDPRVGLEYHRTVGMLATQSTDYPAGQRHKLAAWTSLEVGNLQELAEAAYLFGAAGVGLNLPQSAQDQFPSGYWRVVPGSPIEGGHWIIVVGRWNGYFEGVSWGRRIHITPQFLTTYMSFGAGMLSPEIIGGNGKSPEGYAYAELQADVPLL
jgi:hypothetical protein